MDFDLMLNSFPKLLNATLVTLKLLSLSLIIGLFLGFCFAILRLSKNIFINKFAYGYSYLFRGTPLLVQIFIIYFGLGQIEFLRSFGINHSNIIIDPGIGFGKNLKHNMSLIKNISIFHSLGFPILVGNSRKKFIKELSKKNDTKERIGGTIASSIYLMMHGVQILRIHDVNEVQQGIKVFKAILKN